MSKCTSRGCGADASIEGTFCDSHAERCLSCSRQRGAHNVRHRFKAARTMKIGDRVKDGPDGEVGEVVGTGTGYDSGGSSIKVILQSGATIWRSCEELIPVISGSLTWSPGPHPYVQMHGGHTIDLLEPDPGDYVLESIAFALGHMNRFAGHIGRYSVAEHLVLGARSLQGQGYPRGVQAGYLMHDAHEAVTGDVSSPVKAALRILGIDFGIFESIHERAIQARFKVVTHQAPIKAMDLAMCRAEAEQGFGELIGDGWPDVRPADVTINGWSPGRAMREFLTECSRLDVS